MSRKPALEAMGDAIERALREEPTSEVLSVITGTFVSLTVELIRRHNGEAATLKQIRVDGGKNRDVTIHPPKAAASGGKHAG